MKCIDFLIDLLLLLNSISPPAAKVMPCLKLLRKVKLSLMICKKVCLVVGMINGLLSNPLNETLSIIS